ncbi:MAG TPA: N-acetylmuramoyl-L-alanine amidase [Candidatus Limnocylindrales bacterium]|nr:N-acetylmuramoyl-L-alanine amidase [Candidatus Limnocylindrales bacterium]
MRLSTRLAAVLVLLALSASPVAALTRPAPVVVGRPSLPLRGIVIALDAGHNGGNATHASEIATPVWIGTGWKPCNKVGTSTVAGYAEHAFTFDVALRTKASLEALGATVYMTRTTDTGVGPCIDIRGQFGEKVGAAFEVSIHGDGAPASSHGFFVMKPGNVAGWTDDIYSESGHLASAIRDGLLDAGLSVANYYATNGLKTRTDLGTLNCSDVPVVEIELGNMKNAGDAARMSSRTGRTQYANGIVFGIRRYLGR